VRRRLLFALVTVFGLASAAVGTLEARSKAIGLPVRFEPFAMLEPPLGSSRAPGAARAAVTLAGSQVAALPGGGALVIDPDSGRLIRTDGTGAAAAHREVGRDATQVAVDRRRQLAYAVDRTGDRIHVFSVASGELRPLRRFATRAEPYGVALTPDGDRLLVTAIADRKLTAYAAADGRELWSADLAAEPRGVAVSPDGGQVAVAFLTSGAIMRGRLASGPVRLERIPLQLGRAAPGEVFMHKHLRRTGPARELAALANPRDVPGESHARAAFAVGFIGNGIAVVPHQVSTPHQDEGGGEDAGSYGGGRSAPIAHRLAFVAPEAGTPRVAVAQVGQHQLRALAYDEVRDQLYLVAYGSDAVTAVANASQASVQLGFVQPIHDKGECGPSGAAVADDGRLLVFCSLSRRLAILTPAAAGAVEVAWGGELAPTALTADQLAGRALFRKGFDGRLSRGGGMACESCHPEARTDGLSWRIESRTLQTPMLAGRIAGTHPFKWDGGDKNIDRSLANTVRRLGGSGLSRVDRRHLTAYLESVPRPRAPSVRDHKAVERGKELFASKAVGCAGCHAGPALTDRRSYPLADDLPESDTPSLIGLAGSAPYFHDGSAATLEALLTDRGSVHGMGGTAALDKRQVADLVSYLETL
jgi:hypothetical protein